MIRIENHAGQEGEEGNKAGGLLEKIEKQRAVQLLTVKVTGAPVAQWSTAFKNLRNVQQISLSKMILP